MDLIKKSEDLKIDADYVIAQSKIKELLSRLGKVTFVGSYALNLLYRPFLCKAVIVLEKKPLS